MMMQLFIWQLGRQLSFINSLYDYPIGNSFPCRETAAFFLNDSSYVIGLIFFWGITFEGNHDVVLSVAEVLLIEFFDKSLQFLFHFLLIVFFEGQGTFSQHRYSFKRLCEQSFIRFRLDQFLTLTHSYLFKLLNYFFDFFIFLLHHDRESFNIPQDLNKK